MSLITPPAEPSPLPQPATPPPSRAPSARREWKAPASVASGFVTFVALLWLYTTVTTVNGTITTRPDTWSADTCANTDISPGTPVTVYNAENDTVASGALRQGYPSAGYTCTYPFTVSSMWPSNTADYTVRIGGLRPLVLHGTQVYNLNLFETGY